jgi:hypothetical protein
VIIGFEDEDTTYAKLLTKLKHEGITKRQFFRGVVSSFLEDDPKFADYIIEFKKKKHLFVKSKQKILDKEKQISDNTKRKFRLSEDEIEGLFDMFEEEMDI